MLTKINSLLKKFKSKRSWVWGGIFTLSVLASLAAAKAIFILFVPCAVAAILAFISLYPLKLYARPLERKIEGHFETGCENAEVLLLVSKPVIEKSARSKSFKKTDWSLFWINFLRSKFGENFEVCDIKTITSARLRNRSLIILSKSACAALNHEQVNLLDTVSSNFLIDYPASWEAKSLCNIKVKGVVTPQKITFSTVKDLKNMPLKTNLLMVKSDAFKCVLKMDDHPAIIHTGNKTILLFDATKQFVSMQQGTPADSFKLCKKYGLPRKSFITNLVCDKRMFNNFVPFLSVLHNLIYSCLLKSNLLVGLWPHPFDKNGSVVMTHDEDYFEALNEFVRDIDVPSTVFIIPDSYNSTSTLKQVSNYIDLGIHWNRYFVPLSVFGLHYLHFFKKKLSLHAQISRLKQRDILTSAACRIHGLKWDNDYTNTFRILEGNGIKLDSTYGSPAAGANGYLFGTGTPFRPIDKNGFIFDILELPHFAETYGGFDAKKLVKTIKACSEKYYDTLTLLYHPHFLKKGSKNFKSYLFAIDAAKKNKLWLTNTHGLLKLLNGTNKIRFGLRTNKSTTTLEFRNVPPDNSFLLPARNLQLKSASCEYRQRYISLGGDQFLLFSPKVSSGKIQFCKV